MQKNLKKLLSLFLLVVMILCMFPGTYANDGSVADNNVVDNNNAVVGHSVFENSYTNPRDVDFLFEVLSHVGDTPRDDGTTIYGDATGSNDIDWGISFMNYCLNQSEIYYLPPIYDWASWVDVLKDASNDDITYYHEFTGTYFPSCTGYIPKLSDIIIRDADGDGVADNAGIIAGLYADGESSQYPYTYDAVFANYDNAVTKIENYQVDDSVLGFVPLSAITQWLNVDPLGSGGGNTGGGGGTGGASSSNWTGGWLNSSNPGVAIQVVYYKYKDVYNIDGLWGEVTNSVQNFATSSEHALDKNGDLQYYTVYQPYFVPDNTHSVDGGIFVLQNQAAYPNYGRVSMLPSNRLPNDSFSDRSMSLQYTSTFIMNNNDAAVDDPDVSKFFQRIILGNSWGDWDIGDVDGTDSTYAKVLRMLGASDETINNYLRSICYWGYNATGDHAPLSLTDDGDRLIPVLIWKCIVVQDNVVNTNTGAGVNRTFILAPEDIAYQSVQFGVNQGYRTNNDPGYFTFDFWKDAMPYDVAHTETTYNGNPVTQYSSSAMTALEKGLVFNWANTSDHRCGGDSASSYACKSFFGTGHGRTQHGGSSYSWNTNLGCTDTIGFGYVNYIPADSPFDGYGAESYYFRNYWGPFGGGGASSTFLTGSVLIEKADDADASIKLEGVEFTLYKDAECTRPVTASDYKDSTSNASGTIGYVDAAVRRTDSNGQCSYIDIRAGVYFLKETKNLEDYVPMSGCKQIFIQGNGDASESGNFYQITNKLDKVKGKFKKVVTNGTDADLAGWLFNIYTDVNCSNLYAENIVTGSDGTANVELKPNATYYVKEVGHVDMDNVWNSEYLTSDTSVHALTISSGQHTFELEITNTYYGKLQVMKSVNVGSKAGWKFDVYSNGSCTNLVETITTDSDGVATTGKLTPGTYWVKEVVDTDDYWDYDTKVVEVVVSAKTTATAGLSFSNTHYGRLKIVKDMDTLETDGTKKLAGWQFQITRNSDGADMGIYTTDSTGTVITNNLLPGAYTVREIIDSTNGYYYCETSNSLTVHVVEGQTKLVGGNERVNVSFVNSRRPMSIVLDKVNEKGESLQGVVFSLEWSLDGTTWSRVQYSNAENVAVGKCNSAGLHSDGTLVTDANGHLEFVNLYSGIYYRVTEESTVNGYTLLTEPYVIAPTDVDVTTLTYEMCVVNTPGYTLPEAGVSDMSMNLMIVSGTCAAVLVLFGLCANLSVFNRRKAIKNKKNK